MMKDLVHTVVVILAVVTSASASVQLDVISRLYLPYTYDPEPQYGVLKEVVEQMTFDKNRQLLYTVGSNLIHVVDMSDVSNPRVLDHFTVNDADITDINFCGDFVFTANANTVNRMEGFVDVYRSYVAATKTLERIHHIIVGDLPDMLEITKDCRKVIVAMEAEPFDNETSSTLDDGPGSVVFVNFIESPAGTFTMKTLNFSQFDDDLPELEKQGVRQVYRENGNPFSNDAEPEYIAINKQENIAFVALQENNAVVKLDLLQDQIIDIYGLGYKDWNDLLIDPSNMDDGNAAFDHDYQLIAPSTHSLSPREQTLVSNSRVPSHSTWKMDGYSVIGRACQEYIGIYLNPYRLRGMHQPDAIKMFSFRGSDYLITVGEGDSKDFDHFSEEVRVHDFGLSELYEPDNATRNRLDGNDILGRLKTTNTQGLNSTTNKFDTVYSYGSRSFSIWRTSTGVEQVYDSGSELSEKIAELYPNLFNSHLQLGETLEDSFDSRSDDKGLEPESIEVVEMGTTGIILIFVGFERPGGVFMYSIDESLPTIQPKFETLLIDIPVNNMTAQWSDLYNDRSISIVDCEDIRYIPAEDSPNGEALLLAVGTVTGTVTVIRVDTSSLTETNSAERMRGSFVDVFLVVFLMLVMLGQGN